MRAIGIIAEDKSDVEVIIAIAKKIAKKPFRSERAVGHGCGRIRSKCLAWSKNLSERGCKILLLVHDLDNADLEQLRRALLEALAKSPIPARLILIPVRTIEAWLLADHNAINVALRLKKKISAISNPEAINDPKSHLSELIRKGSANQTIYLNTVHNGKIAASCSISNLRKCSSFRPLEEFLVAQNA